MDTETTALTRLEGLILDAFAAPELAQHLTQWRPALAPVVLELRGISPKQYVQSLISELWRRRMWTGSDGFLPYLAASRERRLAEFAAVTALLDSLGGSTPAEERPPLRELSEGARHLETVTEPWTDLLALVAERLRRSRARFWQDGAELFQHLQPSGNSRRRLRLAVDGAGTAMEAWPHFICAGQMLPKIRAPIRPCAATTAYTYCPHGRGVLPAFSIILEQSRCTLSGHLGGQLYTLQVESTS